MNTILIVCDTWRRDHSGAYGNDWIHTPNINRFAEKAAVFENAYLTSYPTLPCRRDILTGRYEFPWRGWGGLDPDDVTLPQVLGEAEKTSYFITDVYHHWGRDAGNYWRDFTGFSLVRGQERDGYITDTDVDFDRTCHRFPLQGPSVPHSRNAQWMRREERDWFSPQVFSQATRWLQHNADHEDFFLMIDSFDPHEPWDPPRYYTDLYGDPAFDGTEYPVAPYGSIEGKLTPEELRHVQALYAGEITMVDRWFGHFLDQIESLGLLDNTVIILTTDHGTHNGDRGRTGKNWVLMEEISHLPLLVWHPEYGHGTRPKQKAQALDYFPTACEAAGVEIPAGLHGKSLLPFLKDPTLADPREAVLFGEFCQSCYLTDGEWTLTQNVDPANPPLFSYSLIKSKWSSNDWGPFDGTRRLVGPKNANTHGERTVTRLYHLPTDPKQENNLAESPDHAETLLRLQKLMVAKLEAIEAPLELERRFGLDRVG